MIEGYFGGELAHQGREPIHGGIVPHGHHHLVEQYNHRLLLREAADAVFWGLLQGDECMDGHLLLLLDIVLAVPRHTEAYPLAVDAAKAWTKLVHIINQMTGKDTKKEAKRRDAYRSDSYKSEGSKILFADIQ